MNVLVLAENLFQAVRVAAAASLPGVRVHALLCRNRKSRPVMLLGLVRALMRLCAAPALWPTAVSLTLRRALRYFPRVDDPRALAFMHRTKPDVGLHGMDVIYKPAVLDCFSRGIINPHIGLLPEFRGRSVLEWSLALGAPVGVTAFFIDAGVDTGPRILSFTPVDVRGLPGLDAAKARLFALAPAIFKDCLERLSAPLPIYMRNDVSKGRRYYAMSALMRDVAEACLQLENEGAKQPS
jgi:hypothetical protein